jgi:hypothetical protein
MPYSDQDRDLLASTLDPSSMPPDQLAQALAIARAPATPTAPLGAHAPPPAPVSPALDPALKVPAPVEQPDMARVRPLGGVASPQGADPAGVVPLRMAPQAVAPPAPAHWTNTLDPTLRGPIEQGRQEQIAGVQAGANAQAAQATETSGALGEQRRVYEEQQAIDRQTDEQQQRALEQHQAQLAKSAEDLAGAKIDPEHYTKEKGTFGRIGLAIASGLGAFGAALAHTQNFALETINAAISRDIDAQKEGLANKRSSLATQQGLLADKMRIFGDERQARAAARQEMLQATEMRVKELAAKYQSPVYQANAQTLIGKLREESAKEDAAFSKFTPASTGGAVGVVTPAKVSELASKIYTDSNGSLSPEQAREAAMRTLGAASGGGALPAWAKGGAGAGPHDADTAKQLAAYDNAIASTRELVAMGEQGVSLSGAERGRAEAALQRAINEIPRAEVGSSRAPSEAEQALVRAQLGDNPRSLQFTGGDQARRKETLRALEEARARLAGGAGGAPAPAMPPGFRPAGAP